MLEVARRTPVRGPTFIRLIARLAEIDVADPASTPSDRLGQWIDWTRAVALSRALDDVPPAAGPGASGTTAADADDCARTRATLAAAIADGPLPAPAGGTTAPGFGEFRKHYLARQRAMQVEAGRLRGHLRDLLAARSPGMARLAEVDVVMELVLSPKEQALLASIPDLLGTHFERLRDRAAGDAWLAAFRLDMQDVLLAELDVRFQPIEALLAALRQC